ncbi:MAG: hypothetical protein O7C59_03300 [Rickettsia endosymbiont of Ixodes persulcatus]|nr:hypothetical protein [Rickettsia endosymbiont of Ixodes persulcatus]MCZ6903923.1 hypothetical protein [Rickettsia endosymbiont of Ixodes persulcatus]MCZ6909105.1 hypothetical protein [Rickettsia endosymbiont of Ixodes persulcatus]MCZ6911036.1 hypothetical protein [Rickettsia endosymbiont of Ixodes persulcatus]MCZ6913599.1 hypothetical protein [Rickettsia endosymbiont of Ixodes persulcatus]
MSKILETIKLKAEFNKELLTAEIQLSCGNPIRHKMDESKLETLQTVIRDENKLSKILTGEATPATDYAYPPTEFSKLISQITSHKENNSLTFTLNKPYRLIKLTVNHLLSLIA